MSWAFVHLRLYIPAKDLTILSSPENLRTSRGKTFFQVMLIHCEKNAIYLCFSECVSKDTSGEICLLHLKQTAKTSAFTAVLTLAAEHWMNLYETV